MTHCPQLMPRSRRAQVLLQTQNLDLLLHPALLELEHRHIFEVHVLLLGLLRRDRTHELHECLTCLGDGLQVGSDFEPFLHLGHKKSET